MRISKRYIKYLLLLAPLLISSVVYTLTNSLFANILLVLKMVVFLYVTTDYLISRRLSRLDVALISYFIVWFVSVYLNGTDFIEYVKEIVVILSFVFMIENSFQRDEEEFFVLAFEHLIFVELTINLVCLIAFPDGLWKTYSIYGEEAVYTFLGLDNQMTPIFIVAECVLFIKLFLDDFKFSLLSVIYVLVLVGNLMLTMSATGIIGCAIVPLILVLGIRLKRFINIRTVLFAIGCFWILIVLLRLQNIFAFIIEGWFNKDLTLTNRLWIWDSAIEMIKERPLLGYGCGTLSKIIEDRNAHDFYLQIMLQAGLLGIVMYANIFRIALKDCWKERDLGCSLIITATLCGYMVCGIAEVYPQFWLFIILSLGYKVRALAMKKSRNLIRAA